MSLLTDEQTCYLLDHYMGITTTKLTQMLNDRFQTDFTRSQIKNYLSNHGLKNGVVKRFEKGHVPMNKGKKMTTDQYEKVRHTMFKKGNVPANRIPLGTEKERADGYVWVKIQDGKKNKNWKLKHVLIWEKEHGPLQDGEIVIFLDGNTRNFSIENLTTVSKAINARLNQNHLRYKEKELTKAGIAVAELITAANKAKRRMRRD